ncbi:hypothetical protein [Aequorivita soesokkakensis]|nr:hypothetical protein [Aequorivita soesokkakensis]
MNISVSFSEKTIKRVGNTKIIGALRLDVIIKKKTITAHSRVRLNSER